MPEDEQPIVKMLPTTNFEEIPILRFARCDHVAHFQNDKEIRCTSVAE